MKELEYGRMIGSVKVGARISVSDDGCRQMYYATSYGRPVILYCYKHPDKLQPGEAMNPRLDEYYMYCYGWHGILPARVGYGEEEDFLWVCVEFLKGCRPLADYIREEGPMPLDTALILLNELMGAIIEKGINAKGGYNCLDPQHLRVNDSNYNLTFYLVGTEYAGLHGNERTEILCKNMNPGYRAPEIALGQTSFVSDYYSAGKIFYFMLTGKEAELSIDYTQFKNPHILAILRGLLNDDPKEREIFAISEVGDLISMAAAFEESAVKQDGFMKVAGLDEVKSELKRDFVDIITYPELAFAYNLKPHNGWLFYGPPGCGKSFIAEALAEESGLEFILVNPSDLGSKYMHESKNKIADLFNEAAQKGGTIICFDEADALFPRRNNTELNEYFAAEVNEFLIQLNNCADRGIYVIALTNCPDKIDPAVLRTGRIEAKCYIPLPDYETRISLFEMYLRPIKVEDGLDVKMLASKTEGYSCSDIAYIVREAARKKFDECIRLCLNESKPLTQSVLLQVVENTPPSVSKEEKAKYEKIHQEFCGQTIRKKSRIGYKLSV